MHILRFDFLFFSFGMSMDNVYRGVFFNFFLSTVITVFFLFFFLNVASCLFYFIFIHVLCLSLIWST